jgi:hypothetical protein
MPKRRLFRRRENGEWLRENTYVVVTLLALAGGAVAWAALFDEKPRPGPAPAQVAAIATSTAATVEEPTPPADDNVAPVEPPSAPPASDATTAATASEPQPSPVVIAPTQHRAAPDVRGREMPRHASTASKSRRFARPSRGARFALASTIIDRDLPSARRQHRIERRQGQQPAMQARSKAIDDPLDRPYSVSASTTIASNEAAPSPVLEARASTSNEPDPQPRQAACTRAFHAFGAMRRVPTDC